MAWLCVVIAKVIVCHSLSVMEKWTFPRSTAGCCSVTRDLAGEARGGGRCARPAPAARGRRLRLLRRGRRPGRLRQGGGGAAGRMLIPVLYASESPLLAPITLEAEVRAIGCLLIDDEAMELTSCSCLRGIIHSFCTCTAPRINAVVDINRVATRPFFRNSSFFGRIPCFQEGLSSFEDQSTRSTICFHVRCYPQQKKGKELPEISQPGLQTKYAAAVASNKKFKGLFGQNRKLWPLLTSIMIWYNFMLQL